MEGQKQIKRALTRGQMLVDEYRIDSVIGEGGFGITYSGVRRSDQHRVAIKEYFPSQYASREDAAVDAGLHVFGGDKAVQFEKGLAHFMHEAEILKRYSYLEGMVTVLDTCKANNTAYIVMEYVDGITLAQYIRENGVFAYDELVELVTPIIKSLAQIHRQGVIHRDISPENIQIGLDNSFYLLDFGAAKQLDGQKRQNTVIFKQGYAPPEQYTGDGKQGAWTDVYALASTMYTALCGKTLDDAVHRMQRKDDDAIESDLVMLEDWQRNALKKGLELEPSHRYQNMEAFLLALTVKPSIEERITQVSGTVDTTGEDLGVPAGRKRIYAFVIAGIMAMLIIIITAIVYKGRNGQSAETTAESNISEESGSTTEITTVSTERITTEKVTTEKITTERVTTEKTTTEQKVTTEMATEKATESTQATEATTTEQSSEPDTTVQETEAVTESVDDILNSIEIPDDMEVIGLE